jgi:hypothetical protein
MASRKKRGAQGSPADAFSAERVRQLHALEQNLDLATQEAHTVNQRVREQLCATSTDDLLDRVAKPR